MEPTFRRALFVIALLVLAAPVAGAQTTPPFALPAAAPDPSVTIAVDARDPFDQRLVIDGHTTRAHWERHASTPPRAFLLAPVGAAPPRWLVYDDRSSTGPVWLWEPARQRLTALGEGSLHSVPGYGSVVQTLDERGGGRGVLTLYGIAPRVPALVPIFRGSLGARPRVLGHSNGALVVADALGGATYAWTIWRIRAGSAPRVTRARGDFTLEAGDAVRGSQVLALPIRTAGMTGPLRLLDLDTGRLSPLGVITGCMTPLYTNSGGEVLRFHAVFVPSPATPAPAVLAPARCIARVDERRMVLLP